MKTPAKRQTSAQLTPPAKFTTPALSAPQQQAIDTIYHTHTVPSPSTRFP